MKRAWIAVALLCAASTAGYGQAVELFGRGGLSRLHNKELGSGYSLDDGWRFALGMALNSWTFFGQEFGYAYNRTHLRVQQTGVVEQDLGGMAIHQGFYNLLVYATPEGSRFRPFAAGGGHFSNFVPPGASATQGQGSNKFGVNYGGGIKARIGANYMVRVDFRQYLTGKPFGEFFPVNGNLRQNEISVGLAFVL